MILPRSQHNGLAARGAAGLLVLSSLALSNGQAVAQTEISMISAQHTTDLLTRRNTDVPLTQTTVSAAPLNQELQGTSARIYAKAQSDLFAVSTATSAVPESGDNPDNLFAKATAETVLNFRTLHDGLVPLSFEFEGSSLALYSEGLVSLVDLSASETVFSYSWTCCGFQGTVPWEPRSGPLIWNGASLAPDADLLASHDYALTMQATTFANFDSQSVSISVSGLVLDPPAVPEPATSGMLMLGMGLIGVAARRRA